MNFNNNSCTENNRNCDRFLREKMMNYFLLIFLLSVFVADSIEENFPKRPKRVLKGFYLLAIQKRHYKAMEYYVWIGETWSCAEEVSWIVRWGFASQDGPGLHYACLEKPEHEVCGGALISPRIVQTACHCLGKPVVYNERALWSGRMLDTDLKEKYQIFMGFTHLHDMVYPVPSENVFIHQLCGRTSFPPNYGRYDFGWLTLKHAIDWGRGVASGRWGTKLDYAGPYLKDELEREYDRVLSHMHVCMIMGFGDTVHEQSPPDERMSHGYIQIMDQHACSYWLTESFNPQPPIRKLQQVYQKFKETYSLSQTWVCARKIKKFDQHAGHGDSGGPVSCNGQYFAVISQFHKLDTLLWGDKEILGENFIILDMAIKFAPEANAVEMRARFENDTLMPPPPPPSQDKWWTTRDELRRLGKGGRQIVWNPEKHLGNSRTHSNSITQRYYNKAIRSHTATQLCFISVALFVTKRH